MSKRPPNRSSRSSRTSGPVSRSAEPPRNHPPLTPEQKERLRRRKQARRKALIRRRRILIACCIVFLFCVFKLISSVYGMLTKSEKETKEVSSVNIENADAPVEEATATIFTAGDIIMHKPFLTSPVYHLSDGSYDYNSIFTYVKPYFEGADFTSLTLECALTESDYTGYPTFHAPDAIATALASNGVDMCLLANNHIYDNGDAGLQRTMDVMTQSNLLYTGTRKTEEDKPYQIQDINGIKVGFFNYVFETDKINGQKSINGIPVTTESAPLINSFHSSELEQFYKEIETGLEEMKEEGVEFTVAYMHWGIEYQTTESSEQDEMAQMLCDLGIDALIGSHPHVIQPVDLLTSATGDHQMLCAYAIGNHLSNQRTEYMDGVANGETEDGFMVSLEIKRHKDGSVTIEKADFIPTWVVLTTTSGATYYILPVNDPAGIAASSGLNIADSAQRSLDRTNAIIGAGVSKVQQALPIK